MATFTGTPIEIAALLRRHFGDALDKRLEEGLRSAARKGAELVRTRTPELDGNLRASVHAEKTSIVVGDEDAPYAAAVELGTPTAAPQLFVRNSIPTILQTVGAELRRALKKG